MWRIGIGRAPARYFLVLEIISTPPSILSMRENAGLTSLSSVPYPPHLSFYLSSRAPGLRVISLGITCTAAPILITSPRTKPIFP